MTTTLTAIIDEQIGVIEALTPKSLANVKFRSALDEIDFREWAEEQKTAAFRRFTIEEMWDYESTGCVGPDVMMEPVSIEVIVAYPLDCRYGKSNRRAMHDVMREDRAQIDYAIGAYGTGNMSDSSAVLMQTGYEEGEDSVLMSLRFMVYFYRSTSGETYVATQNSSEQSWQYTVTAAASSFAITIPKAMADATYTVPPPTHTATFGCSFKITDKTTTGFTLVCGAILPVGTVIDLQTRDA